MTRSNAAIGPVLVALLAVLALSVTGAPALHAPSSRAGVPLAAPQPSPPTSSAAGRVVVAPAFVPGSRGTWVGPVPAATSINVLVGLAPPSPASLQAEAAAEYTLGSGLYHHFLSPSQVAGQYGAAPTAILGAERYFAGFGLTAQGLPGGSLLSVTGPAAGVGAAFGTSFEEYRSATGRPFVSHPTPASLPSSLPWTGAVGLGNVTLPIPLAMPAPVATSAALVGPASSCAGSTGALSPCQVSGAYDAAGLIGGGTNGTGERIGVVDVYDGIEPQSRLASDLSTFDSTFVLPAPSLTFDYPVKTSVDLNATSTGWGLEEALDLEWSHAAAPGASIAMTFAPNSNLGLYEAVDWLVSTHRVDVISLSWGEPDIGVYNSYASPCSAACNASADGSYEVLGPVLAAAALEGISVFAASGDCGSADGTNGVSTNYPSSDPFVTGVGGTALAVSTGGTWEGEVAWSGNSTGARSPGCMNRGGSGGGFAPFPRPWWQSGPGVPAPPGARGNPDVAADAATPVEIFEGGGAQGVIGTSVATPLWAGVAAIADQYAGGALGFLDPELYTILRSPNYATAFHDITSGNNGAYSATTGWDPVTGIGTPNVASLVADLAQPVRSLSTLQVGLAASPLRGALPLTVSFFVLPSGGSGDYPVEGISFGDGTSALAPTGNASHVFSRAGVYPAVAYVADSSGNVSGSAPVAVVVGGAPIRVNLTVSDPTPAVGATDNFTANASGGTGPYAYLFAFGDGTFLNGSTVNSTSHAFPVAGGFCADVIVTDSSLPEGGGTSAVVPVEVGGASAPVCANRTGPFSVAADATPGVRDAPADYPSLFRVYGGNGTGSPTEVLSSTDPYVGACGCTIFRAPGTYSVTMSAVNSWGVHAANETNVTVAPPLLGTFTTSTPYGDAPLLVNFSASVTGGHGANAAQTAWQFGDGTTATGGSVSHTYGTPGTYFATGDVEDSGHGNASEGFLIDVLPAGGSPTPALTAGIEPAVNGVAGTSVSFSAATNSSAAPVRFNWSLGSGSSALAPGTSATFTAPSSVAGAAGDFWLNVTWPLSHRQVDVSIREPTFLAVEANGFVPRADALSLAASAGPSFGTAPVVWAGSASASGPGLDPVAWTFGNGNSSVGALGHAEYGVPGDYTANVTATDAWNDSARLPFGVAVHASAPVSVRASVSPQKGAAPLTVTVDATASGGAGAPYGYAWSFGNGAFASAAVASATYSTPGQYNLSLTVTDSAGTSVLTSWTVVVTSGSSPPAVGGGEPTAVLLGVAAVFGGLVAVGVAVSSRRARERPPTTP